MEQIQTARSKPKRYHNVLGSHSSPEQHSSSRDTPNASSRPASTGDTTHSIHDDHLCDSPPMPGNFPQPGYDFDTDSASDDEPLSTPSSSISYPVLPTRPTRRDTRSISDPTPIQTHGQPPPTFTSPTTTVTTLLKKPPNTRQTHNKSGFIYIFTATHNGTPITKIGHTTADTVDARLQAHRSTCRELNLQAVSEALPHQQIKTYYRRVEKLAHAELRGCRYSFACACSCGRRHDEFFAVDPGVAYRVVKRWVRFCEREPWWVGGGSGGGGRDGEEGGRLKPEWVDRLEGLRVDEGPSRGRGEGSSAEMWDSFVGMGVWACLWHDAWAWMGLLWRSGWWTPLVAVLGGFSSFCARQGWVPAALVAAAALVVVLLFATAALVEGRPPRWRGYVVWRLLVGVLIVVVVVLVCYGEVRLALVMTAALVIALVCGLMALAGFRSVTWELLRTGCLRPKWFFQVTLRGVSWWLRMLA